MVLNRKELKKISHGFNTISSRMLRVAYDEYKMVLKKFLGYIEENSLIMDYIQIGNTGSDFDISEKWEKVKDTGHMFEFDSSVAVESYQIYILLKYIEGEVDNPGYIFSFIYQSNQWQDGVKEFNNRVTLVLINNINEYLTGVGIDMGLDENVVWNVSGGQINIASDNAKINAVQNNENSMKEIEKISDIILENLSEITIEDAETIKDSVEMIRDELRTPQPKSNIISNGIKLLAPMISIVNGIPTLGDNLCKFIELVKPFIK